MFYVIPRIKVLFLSLNTLIGLSRTVIIRLVTILLNTMILFIIHENLQLPHMAQLMFTKEVNPVLFRRYIYVSIPLE